MKRFSSEFERLNMVKALMVLSIVALFESIERNNLLVVRTRGVCFASWNKRSLGMVGSGSLCRGVKENPLDSINLTLFLREGSRLGYVAWSWKDRRARSSRERECRSELRYARVDLM